MDFVAWLTSIHLTDLGDVASILGLLVSIWVLIKVKAISNSYFKKVRLPALLQDLGKLTSKLSSDMGNTGGSEESLRLLIGKIEGLLTSLKKQVGGTLRTQLASVSKEISEYKRNGRTETKARDIYVACVTLSEALKEQVKDLEWER